MGQTIQRWLPCILILGGIISSAWLLGYLRPTAGNYVIIVNASGLKIDRPLQLMVPTIEGGVTSVELKSPNRLGSENQAVCVFEIKSAFGDGTAKLIESDGALIKSWHFDPPGRYNCTAVMFIDPKVHHASFNTLNARTMGIRAQQADGEFDDTR